MTVTKGRHPGATWRKSDLQIHTPRDRNWKGSPHLPGGNDSAELKRDQWADGFVETCLIKGLEAIAITDHHDLVMFPYVQRSIAKKGLTDRLWLFPGMEVTCNDSVQCLVLFNRGTDYESAQRLFGGHLPKVKAAAPVDAQTVETNLCGKDIVSLIEGIYEDEILKVNTICLPNASGGGHKDILRRGFHFRFAELAVDGVYNEKHFGELDEGTLKRIRGELIDWGVRRRGIITTGDNRNENFEALASNTCWLRLGEPTVEGIRQAVLADEARIVFSPPNIPVQRIKELRVNSSITGADFELTFNDGFNALIGGRGSGKSAVLEYLRFGLGRSTMDTEIDETQDRERGLITDTLQGGHVSIVLDRNGVLETWTRALPNSATIKVEQTGSSAVDLPIAEAQERFRARAFYQRQLSTLVRKSETADAQITGIAAAEFVDKRRLSERRIEEAQRSVQIAFQGLVQAWSAEAAHMRAFEHKLDVQNRVNAAREKLDESGLSPADRSVLDEAPSYAKAEDLFDGFQSDVASLEHKLEALTPIDTMDWNDLKNQAEIASAKLEIDKLNYSIQGVRTSLQEKIRVSKEAIAAQLVLFEDGNDKFQKRYEAAKMAQQQLKSMVDQYTQLTEELSAADKTERSAKTMLSTFSGADKRLDIARATLMRELEEMKQLLSDASSKIEAMSPDTLRARVEEEASPKEYQESLIEICEKCLIRDLETKCISSIEAHCGANTWDTFVNKIMAIRRARVTGGDGADVDQTLLANLRDALWTDLTPNQTKLVLARIDDARVGQLLSATARAFIRFEYKDRGAYMPFERASPGQQASALLALLLKQEAGTLIIDQPEDDLDNRVIMSIVKLLQQTKQNRQLIFATHNPNLVVNGDADKIIVLSPSVHPHAPAATSAAQIQIETDGAIETPDVQKAITATMEGGRDAFELRSRKYAFSA